MSRTRGISSMDELCDECVRGNSSSGEEEEDEYDPQPKTSCAGAHITNATVISFFSMHITGRCNKQNVLNMIWQFHMECKAAKMNSFF